MVSGNPIFFDRFEEKNPKKEKHKIRPVEPKTPNPQSYLSSPRDAGNGRGGKRRRRGPWPARPQGAPRRRGGPGGAAPPSPSLSPWG